MLSSTHTMEGIDDPGPAARPMTLRQSGRSTSSDSGSDSGRAVGVICSGLRNAYNRLQAAGVSFPDPRATALCRNLQRTGSLLSQVNVIVTTVEGRVPVVVCENAGSSCREGSNMTAARKTRIDGIAQTRRNGTLTIGASSTLHFVWRM